MRSAVLLLPVVAALSAPAGARAQNAPTDREYAVWSDLLESYIGGMAVDRIVVADTTVQGDPRRGEGPFEERARPRRRVDPLPADLLQSFAEANATRWPLEPGRLKTFTPLQRVSEAGPRNVPAEDDRRAWANLRNAGYPGSAGIASVSRVGFSADGRTALVYLELYCGPRYGMEIYFLLRQLDNGRWLMNGLYITRNQA